jgi:hypothetical protein
MALFPRSPCRFSVPVPIDVPVDARADALDVQGAKLKAAGILQPKLKGRENNRFMRARVNEDRAE